MFKDARVLNSQWGEVSPWKHSEAEFNDMASQDSFNGSF
jgi:hypothetical protein